MLSPKVLALKVFKVLPLKCWWFLFKCLLSQSALKVLTVLPQKAKCCDSQSGDSQSDSQKCAGNAKCFFHPFFLLSIRLRQAQNMAQNAIWTYAFQVEPPTYGTVEAWAMWKNIAAMLDCHNDWDPKLLHTVLLVVLHHLPKIRSSSISLHAKHCCALWWPEMGALEHISNCGIPKMRQTKHEEQRIIRAKAEKVKRNLKTFSTQHQTSCTRCTWTSPM